MGIDADGIHLQSLFSREREEKWERQYANGIKL